MTYINTIVVLSLILINSPLIAEDQWYEVRSTIEPVQRTFEGQVEAIRQATVSSQTSGRVAKINYDVDDFVPVGSVLIEFTNTEQKQAVQKSQANLESAKASEKEAIANFKRVKTTFDRKLISQSDYDLAVSKKNTASAEVKAQQAVLDTAITQLDYTLVKAPFDGIVTSRHIEKGETVDIGMPVMSGLSLNHLRAISHVPESLISQIKSISLAHIKLPNNEIIESAELTLFPYADPQSRTFELRVNLPEKTTGLFPGMSTQVSFNLGSQEMILIPHNNIVNRGELTLVYVKQENKILPRQIITGNVFKHFTEVISGIKAGDIIMSNPLAQPIFSSPTESIN
jgi:RND family efflux transporter MFP subunit